MNQDPQAVVLDTPWERAWPASGLEAVDACPLCGSVDREVVHEALVDSSFRVAPGRWTLMRCRACGAGHLDPRPSSATIHAAYRHYYTHERSDAGPAPAGSLLHRVVARLANGYTNGRYGTRREPACALGVVAYGALTIARRGLDRKFRDLPRREQGAGDLLDVGCGDGAFLELARECGWHVLGLEPDAQAAATTAARGVPVLQGGLEQLDDRASAFDFITLSHVIEHVHDPVETLRACHRLLKPGGRLWIETPNLDSGGHVEFGVHWRGLEAPRHLVIFTLPSLHAALRRAGFEAPEMLPVLGSRRWIYQRSEALEQGRLPDQVAPLSLRRALKVLRADLFDGWFPERREFLTLSARKSP